jgi:hypothetical protein
VNFTPFYLQERIRNAGSEHMLLYAARSEKKQKTNKIYSHKWNINYNSIGHKK